MSEPLGSISPEVRSAVAEDSYGVRTIKVLFGCGSALIAGMFLLVFLLMTLGTDQATPENAQMAPQPTPGLLAANTATAKLPPAAPIWDGNDGLRPPLKLRYSHYLSTPSAPGPPFHLVWRIEEEWATPDRSRRVNIVRAQLESQSWAISFMECFLNPGRNVFIDNGGKWDANPVLGSRSLTTSASALGNNHIWFVLGKELVDFEYNHPNRPPKALEWQQATLQIGGAIVTKIRASGEDATPLS